VQTVEADEKHMFDLIVPAVIAVLPATMVLGGRCIRCARYRQRQGYSGEQVLQRPLRSSSVHVSSLLMGNSTTCRTINVQRVCVESVNVDFQLAVFRPVVQKLDECER
jgi:hypothetical protein